MHAAMPARNQFLRITCQISPTKGTDFGNGPARPIWASKVIWGLLQFGRFSVKIGLAEPILGEVRFWCDKHAPEKVASALMEFQTFFNTGQAAQLIRSGD